MNMCKFSEQSDNGYQRVSSFIINFVRKAEKDLASGEKYAQYPSKRSWSTMTGRAQHSFSPKRHLMDLSSEASTSVLGQDFVEVEEAN